MRIAIVAHHARPTGGQDRYVLELARQLGAHHDVHLVVVRADGLEGVPVTVHQLGITDRPVIALAPRFVRRAHAYVARGGFDIVHAVGGSLPGANVITAQYCHAAWHEARARYRVHEGAPLAAAYQWLVGTQSLAYERLAYANPALRSVIAVSQITASELARHYRVPGAITSVVHNGADPAEFDRLRFPEARGQLRAELGLPADALIALLVGTYARKGLETAIHAVARALSDLHLAVAGTGDVTLARRWAASAGLEGRLHLLGRRTDVARLYAGADIFVLPTRYEPFGMVIAEAMASSLPVVVSGCAGATELIASGQNGFVVDAADDVAGFAGHLRFLALDGARRVAVGRAARTAALAVAWPNVAAQTEAAYQKALA